MVCKLLTYFLLSHLFAQTTRFTGTLGVATSADVQILCLTPCHVDPFFCNVFLNVFS